MAPMNIHILNSENVMELNNIIFSRIRGRPSHPLLSFAMSCRRAWYYMAVFVNKHFCLEVPNIRSVLLVRRFANGKVDRFDDAAFIRFCLPYVSRLSISCGINRDHTDNYYRYMTSLEHACVYIEFSTRYRSNDYEWPAYYEMLEAINEISTLEVNDSFFKCMEKSITAVRMPNLTKLVITDHLSKITPTKFTFLTYPRLETLEFNVINFSKDGITKLSRFCKTMSYTIKTIDVKSTERAMFDPPGYSDLFDDKFKRIWFRNTVALNVFEAFKHLNMFSPHEYDGIDDLLNKNGGIDGLLNSLEEV